MPMFIPVTMNSAERIVETIQDIKEKIPSDPFEAELILMAEMVAQQNEGSDKEKTQGEKESQAKEGQQEAAPTEGTCGTFASYQNEFSNESFSSIRRNQNVRPKINIQ